MRIREKGKHAHRTDTIEQAAEFWGCNKTTALMRSADFARRIEPRIREVVARDDLTTGQKREIAATLSVPGTFEVTIQEELTVDLGEG
jgi:hypothetical protein